VANEREHYSPIRHSLGRIVARKSRNSLRQAHRAFCDISLAQIGVDGFAKPLRAHLVAFLPYLFCFDSPQIPSLDQSSLLRYNLLNMGG
jgi:hypothetical protein